MKTIDLKKESKYLCVPSVKNVEIIQVPCLQFTIFDGTIENRPAQHNKEINCALLLPPR